VFACSPSSTTPSTTEPPVNGTSVIILANHCRLSKDASRQAEATMNRLVDHCNGVFAHALTFGVVLEPKGTISFTSAGDGGNDEIPMCVATQQLQHRVKLTTACTLDVRFAPTSIVTHSP
jgi:hypothetical protein